MGRSNKAYIHVFSCFDPSIESLWESSIIIASEVEDGGESGEVVEKQGYASCATMIMTTKNL